MEEGFAGADTQDAKKVRRGAVEEGAASKIGAAAGAADAAPGEGTSCLSIRQAKPNEILHCKDLFWLCSQASGNSRTILWLVPRHISLALKGAAAKCWFTVGASEPAANGLHYNLGTRYQH